MNPSTRASRHRSALRRPALLAGPLKPLAKLLLIVRGCGVEIESLELHIALEIRVLHRFPVFVQRGGDLVWVNQPGTAI